MQYRVIQDHMSIEGVAWAFVSSQVDDRARAARIARAGFVEAILDHNPGLAALVARNGDVVPLGTIVTMPALPDNDEFTTVNLWE